MRSVPKDISKKYPTPPYIGMPLSTLHSIKSLFNAKDIDDSNLYIAYFSVSLPFPYRFPLFAIP